MVNQFPATWYKRKPEALFSEGSWTAESVCFSYLLCLNRFICSCALFCVHKRVHQCFNLQLSTSESPSCPLTTLTFCHNTVSDWSIKTQRKFIQGCIYLWDYLTWSNGFQCNCACFNGLKQGEGMSKTPFIISSFPFGLRRLIQTTQKVVYYCPPLLPFMHTEHSAFEWATLCLLYIRPALWSFFLSSHKQQSKADNKSACRLL